MPSHVPLTTIPGVEAWPLSSANGPIRISIAREPSGSDIAAPNARIAARWSTLCAANPRLFDGPILTVLHFDPSLNTILARRGNYASLAVQPEVPTGTKLLSTTAVLTATDSLDRRFALLGKRSRQTRIYGNMWELGPSGGLPVPPAAIEHLTAREVLAGLSDEVHEEVGITVNQGQIIAYTRDAIAHSDDIVLHCDLGSLEEATQQVGPANWEYQEVLWLPIDSVQPFDEANADTIIPTTRAIFRLLNWIEHT